MGHKGDPGCSPCCRRDEQYFCRLFVEKSITIITIMQIRYPGVLGSGTRNPYQRAKLYIVHSSHLYAVFSQDVNFGVFRELICDRENN